MLLPLLTTTLMALVVPSEPAAVPAVVELKNSSPNADLIRGGKATKPTLIRSEEDAAKHFKGDALANLKKQVDFDSQMVLVFAWQGSGQDKLTVEVGESNPEHLFFKWMPGRTRDLRPHAHVYAVRSNVKWSAK